MARCTYCYCVICGGCEYRCDCAQKCDHCKEPKQLHTEDGKCLFAATQYTSGGQALPPRPEHPKPIDFGDTKEASGS